MSATLFSVAMTVFAGAIMTAQPVINGLLGQKVGIWESSFINFLVGTIILAVLVLVIGQGDVMQFRTQPWWVYTAGGAIGVVVVTVMLYVVPQLGTTVGMGALLAGQMAAALVLDHVGFLGMEQISVSPMRLVGVGLVFIGVYLVSVFK